MTTALAEPTDAAAEAFHVPSLRRLAWASALTALLGFGGLGMWAALTPLDSAVPATGVFVAAGKRKTVTLGEAGTLVALLVREGDHVTAGQPLLTLDDVQQRANLNQVEAQSWGAAAKAARLEAELQDRRVVQFPDDLLAAARSNPAINALVQGEHALFVSRWDGFDGSARITARKIQQLQTQIVGIQVQRQTLQTRLALTEDEARGTETLLKEGFAPRTQALAMRRAIAEMQGAVADADARFNQAREAIEQEKLELTAIIEGRRSDAARDLQDAKAAMADVAQRLTAARSELGRTVVTAPEDGLVTDIKSFTPGSSILPGQPVLDVVPGDGKLLIEAAVPPTEIEHVHVGQSVNIRLSAYKTHRVPTVSGRLVYVAADRQQDARGEPEFLVRAELDADALTPYPGVVAYAGMPADVLIIGSHRSALDFLTSPIRDGMRGGMREE